MENDKKALLNFAEKNGWKYSRLYVAVKFGAIGGMIGGFIFALGVGFDMIFIHNQETLFNSETLATMILGFFGLGLLGIIFGGIPASLTGLYFALRKTVITSWWDYLHLYSFGTLVSAISFIPWWNFRGDTTFQIWLSLWLLGSVGGISAMICGKLFLPKLDLEQAKPI